MEDRKTGRCTSFVHGSDGVRHESAGVGLPRIEAGRKAENAGASDPPTTQPVSHPPHILPVAHAATRFPGGSSSLCVSVAIVACHWSVVSC